MMTYDEVISKLILWHHKREDKAVCYQCAQFTVVIKYKKVSEQKSKVISLLTINMLLFYFLKYVSGDSLLRNADMAFTTKDQDNDKYGSNCAVEFNGALWYKSCSLADLNGEYLGGEHNKSWNGVLWFTWKSHKYSLRRTAMKIRPLGDF